MNRKELNCCCCGDRDCVICGSPLVYLEQSETRVCSVCHRRMPANAVCTAGHFVCDECHEEGSAAVIHFLSASRERDPIALYLQVCALPGVHLHGPEHHGIVPCVLAAAYHNCGGELPLEEALQEAWKRGKKIPGGSCGFLGVCGAAAGAGIFASILCDATPLTAEVWEVPQKLTAKCLVRMTALGGPRCCKRTGRLSIEEAAEFVRVRYRIEMPVSRPVCTYSGRNRECIGLRCPYFGG